MNQLIKKIWERHRKLPLGQQIFNEICVLLILVSILGSAQSFIISQPFGIPILLFGLSLLGIGLLWISNVKKKFKISMLLFTLIIYSSTILGWFYSAGINGTAVLVLLAINVYTMGFYSKNYLLLLILNVVTFSSLAILSYWYPQAMQFSYRNETERLFDIVTTYLLIATSVVLVLNTILRNYNRTNKIVIDQKVKLELVYDELAQANNQLVLKNDRLEQKNQQISQQAEELKQLLYTRDKLFSIIAHDLRSPFHNILGFSELLIEKGKDFEVAESEKCLGLIYTSAKDTLVLLENLLNWTKSQTGQISYNPKKIFLSSIIQKTIEISSAAANIKNISLNRIQPDEIEVYADENLLRTVLRNLISNAIKYTESGGNVNIFVISVENQVEISISDDGVGMNDEIRKKLFDISTNITTKGTANENGSGLGLVLCKEFVEKHNGEIWVESEEGKGSDFKFTLPLNKLNGRE